MKTSPSTTPTISGKVVSIGQRAPTAKGSVIVYAYEATVAATGATPDSGNRYVAFDVEGCAGSKADARTGVQPEAFYLQVDRFSYHPSNPGIRRPALAVTVLAPGRCARGWITFEIPKDSKPQFIFFRSSPRIAWRVPA